MLSVASLELGAAFAQGTRLQWKLVPKTLHEVSLLQPRAPSRRRIVIGAVRHEANNQEDG